MLNCEAACEVERFLRYRNAHKETLLISLPSLVNEIGVGSIQVKDEGHRRGRATNLRSSLGASFRAQPTLL
ncbi:hypothetical protein [Bradyrhizobium canariense]|nr:hypothetical protein [Bradyrhizobium canariense]